MSISLLQALAPLALLAVVSAGADAATPPGTPHPCSTVADPIQRLACYDAAFPPVEGARSMAEDRKAAAEEALQNFGLSKAQLRMRDPAGAGIVSLDRIQATITRIGERATGERIIALDNGQVWLLPEVTSKGWLERGDRIVIREAALGSFMLVTPRGINLRIRRID